MLTFDFSSSSKMAFLGLGGGRFSSLSGGSSGSCLIIPDWQTKHECLISTFLIIVVINCYDHFDCQKLTLTLAVTIFHLSDSRKTLTLFFQHLIGIRDLGLIRQPQCPAIDQLQDFLLYWLWWPWAQVLRWRIGNNISELHIKHLWKHTEAHRHNRKVLPLEKLLWWVRLEIETCPLHCETSSRNFSYTSPEPCDETKMLTIHLLYETCSIYKMSCWYYYHN